jgi:hypothetical protein
MSPYDQVAAVLADTQDGPWRASGGQVWKPTDPTDPTDFSGTGVALATLFEADARFIALARNTYPADLRTALSDLEAKIREVMP